jgi:hypothetical protein
MRHAHGRVYDYDHRDRFFERLVGRIDPGYQWQNPGPVRSATGR